MSPQEIADKLQAALDGRQELPIDPRPLLQAAVDALRSPLGVRDAIAAAALPAVIGSDRFCISSYDFVAREAYYFADAMLRARADRHVLHGKLASILVHETHHA